MVRNKVFRFVYWLTGSFFFFAAAVLIISYLRPGPTETQVETWMAGMMSAMHNSLLGVTMEAPEIYSFLMSQAAQISVLMIFLGLVTGLAIRVWKSNDQR